MSGHVAWSNQLNGGSLPESMGWFCTFHFFMSIFTTACEWLLKGESKNIPDIPKDYTQFCYPLQVRPLAE